MHGANMKTFTNIINFSTVMVIVACYYTPLRVGDFIGILVSFISMSTGRTMCSFLIYFWFLFYEVFSYYGYIASN
jgi:hypothetical protein